MIALDTVVLCGLLAVTASGADKVWPFFALAFVQGIGSAIGPREPCSDALAGAAGDPRRGARAALDRLPADRRRRAGGGRPAVRDRGRARLHRRDRALARCAHTRAGRAVGSHACVGRRRRSRRRPRGRAPDSSHAGALRCDLARPLRGAPRWRGRVAPDLREGHPRGRAHRPRAAPRRGPRRGPSSPRSSSPAIRSASVPGRFCSSSSRASARR